MVELNNRNALLRIYSRMVSASFIGLSMMMPFTLVSTRVSIACITFLMAISVVLYSYQNRLSMGRTFYTFALVSLGSIFEIHILYYVPIFWLTMAFYLQTMSWRTFFASILGVVAPYWFVALGLFFVDTPVMLANHFAQLVAIPMPPNYLILSPGQLLSACWIVVMVVTGAVHFVRTSFLDSIRIRMIFNMFMLVSVFSILLLVVMPQHFDIFIRVLVIVASPLIAHFISLTHTRVTNIAFVAIMIITFAVTVFNLWMQLSLSL